MPNNEKKRTAPQVTLDAPYVLDLQPLANRVIGKESKKARKGKGELGPDFEINLAPLFRPMTLSADADKLLRSTIDLMNQTMVLVEIAAKPKPSKPKPGPKKAPAKKTPNKKTT